MTARKVVFFDRQILMENALSNSCFMFMLNNIGTAGVLFSEIINLSNMFHVKQHRDRWSINVLFSEIINLSNIHLMCPASCRIHRIGWKSTSRWRGKTRRKWSRRRWGTILRWLLILVVLHLPWLLQLVLTRTVLYDICFQRQFFSVPLYCM